MNETFCSEQWARWALLAGLLFAGLSFAEPRSGVQLNSSRRIGSLPRFLKVTVMPSWSPVPLTIMIGQALWASASGTNNTANKTSGSAFAMQEIIQLPVPPGRFSTNRFLAKRRWSHRRWTRIGARAAKRRTGARAAAARWNVAHAPWRVEVSQVCRTHFRIAGPCQADAGDVELVRKSIGIFAGDVPLLQGSYHRHAGIVAHHGA